MLPNTPGWSALATKVGNTLRQRYRTARGAFKGRPPKRRCTKTRPRKPHLQFLTIHIQQFINKRTALGFLFMGTKLSSTISLVK